MGFGQRFRFFLFTVEQQLPYFGQVSHGVRAVVIAWATGPKRGFIKLYALLAGIAEDHGTDLAVAYWQRVCPSRCWLCVPELLCALAESCVLQRGYYCKYTKQREAYSA